jgi:hypothetical protein
MIWIIQKVITHISIPGDQIFFGISLNIGCSKKMIEFRGFEIDIV